MKLTRRGRIVVALILIAAAYGLIQVSMNLWFIGDGLCWGSVEECLLKGDK